MRIDISKFAGKEDLFRYLIDNKGEILDLKKSELKHSDEFGVSIFEKETQKALNTSHKDDPTSGVIKRTIIANTYNWMDSHDDVHLDNTFGVSIKQNQGRIWHLADHEFKLTARVGEFEKVYEKNVSWKDLGVNKIGETMSLFADSAIMQKRNALIYDDYLTGKIDQHSVGMMYVKISLAMNDPEEKEEYKEWTDNIHKIGNREEVEKQGFFFAVKEAKLKEISAVLEGSNKLTNTVQNIDPSADSQKNHPDHTSEEKIAKTTSILIY